jgi:transcriptional regulator with XRE-family HTH domain
MKMIENHSERSESPAELRAMFGRNLRLLCQPYASVSALCRELGINRTQFNRYLSGESFPRPDILQRICAYFKVDARILLQPLHEVQNSNTDVIFSNEMEDFLTAASSLVNTNIGRCVTNRLASFTMGRAKILQNFGSRCVAITQNT